MKLVYPTKQFLQEAKIAINRHEIFDISILGGWRSKVLSKEVGKWPARAENGKIVAGSWKPPSLLCGLLMAPLLTIHYAALSVGYKMRCEITEDLIVLTYLTV